MAHYHFVTTSVHITRSSSVCCLVTGYSSTPSAGPVKVVSSLWSMSFIMTVIVTIPSMWHMDPNIAVIGVCIWVHVVFETPGLRERAFSGMHDNSLIYKFCPQITDSSISPQAKYAANLVIYWCPHVIFLSGLYKHVGVNIPTLSSLGCIAVIRNAKSLECCRCLKTFAF